MTNQLPNKEKPEEDTTTPPQQTGQKPEFKAVPSQGLPDNTSETPQFRAAVGMSRKLNAREAGREVAVDTLNKLGKNVKPDFFLLFSTIHYEKHGGFQELLNGVWDILPKGTPLIGGTVAGFINPQGCYTRGATALAVNYPNMDVAIGIGHNTKRNPKKAAQQCAQQIKEKLKTSKYETKYSCVLISGCTVPQIPGFQRKRIFNGLNGEIVEKSLGISLSILQKGIDRFDELIKNFTEVLNDYYTISGALMDDMWMSRNYQFINNRVNSNTIIALGITSDLKLSVKSEHNLEKRLTFKATKLSNDRRIIQKINGKPARNEFLNLLHWPGDYLDERVYRKTLFYPIGFNLNGQIIPEVLGLVLGNSILFTYQIPHEEVSVFQSSGSNMLLCVDKCISSTEINNPLLSIVSECAARLQGLGSHIYSIHSKLTAFHKDRPFIVFYVGGEATYDPKIGLKYGNETFNISTFSKNE